MIDSLAGMPDDGAVEVIRKMILEYSSRDENEADTRHRIIDFFLHDIFAWPRNRVDTERYLKPGFADYILKKQNDDDIFFIEAKKSGVFFNLPQPHNIEETSCYIQVSKLLTDAPTKAAIDQVRGYCLETGCEFACITNGHEWIMFKTFEKGKRWESLQAFVIRNLHFFERDYTRAYNIMSYISISERLSLPTLLSSTPPKDRDIFYAKDRIPSYSHAIAANKLAPKLRPIVTHYFGVIGDDDNEFMERCYVSQRDFQQSYDGMRNIIQDSLSPYFQEYGVQQLDENGKGGRLGGRLTKNIKKGRKGEVLLLFGGKGAGKSTFIKRLLYHNPPRWLRDHSVVVILDLLKVPENVHVIRRAIWEGLVSSLDTSNIMIADRGELISKLFLDRFLIASRQELSGLPRSSDAYNSKLNQLISEWKQDYIYCAKRLVDFWKDQDKGVIVVVDNTDQYSGSNQDFCFSSAQEIADQLGCITVISMREERFYNSKIHGVLDAFQNAGFHISSPKPADVFRRRLDYTVSLLNDDKRRAELAYEFETQLAQDCSAYLGIVSREFNDDRSPLNAFLTACAHGDIRLSLDLFRSFLLSGYTNVDEMLMAGRWNFQPHQVIKPVMIPTRYFYDEILSDIPNIYQLRYNRHGSHFTSLRVLRKLAKNVEGSSSVYTTVAELKSYFLETFNMIEDFERNLDVLLRHGLVESNNRIDFFSEAVDSLKITSYGVYVYTELAYDFTYLDLICIDCGCFDQQTSNYLVEAAKDEYDMFLRHNRIDRVRVRLDRVEKFLEYINAEENREKMVHSLTMPQEEMFTHRSKTNFSVEKSRVIESAQKQKSRRSVRRRPLRRKYDTN